MLKRYDKAAGFRTPDVQVNAQVVGVEEISAAEKMIDPDVYHDQIVVREIYVMVMIELKEIHQKEKNPYLHSVGSIIQQIQGFRA